MRTIRNASALRTAMLALGACATIACSNSSDADKTADAMGGAGTTAGAGAMGDSAGMSGMNAGGTAGAVTMSDANIMSAIGMSNASEIGAGKVAQTKATNASVKAYAKKMVDAHTAAQGEADKLGTSANITPAPASDAEAMRSRNETDMNMLNSTARGSAFDRAYIDGQVAAHQMTLDNLRRFEGMAQNADLKAHVAKMIPAVQAHLDEAKQLQGQLGTAS